MADDTELREQDHEPNEAPVTGDPAPCLNGDEVAAAVVARFPDAVFHDSHGQAVVYVARDAWHDVAAFLRDEQQFTQCVDVTAVDHLVDVERALPDGVQGERYEVVANFLSHPRNRRIRTICEVADGDTPKA